jgi:hypothetical protein
MRKKKKPGKLSWWWFMFKMNIMIKRMDIDYKIKRWFYCRRGYHFLIHDGFEITSQRFDRKKKKWIKRTVVRLNYLRCPYCNFLFFSSDADKKKYEWNKEREMRMFKRAFKLDDLNAGKKDKRTVSKDNRNPR